MTVDAINTFARVEMRMIDHRKKVFCIKQKIPLNNIYERVFTLLNNKIIYQIDLEKIDGLNNKNAEQALSMDRYPLIYKKTSKHVLKLIKDSKSTNQATNSNEFNIAKSIRRLDLKSLLGKENKTQGQSKAMSKI